VKLSSNQALSRDFTPDEDLTEPKSAKPIISFKNFVIINIMMAESDVRKNHSSGPSHVSTDFQCFVCGAVFTTDEDRKQHLEKESHGDVRNGTTKEEMRIARDQEESNEQHTHHV
jgi:hypothetical protein